MADSGTAPDSNTPIVENGSDPPDVPSTVVAIENQVEGADLSKEIKKDEEEKKGVDVLKGVVEENRGIEDLKDVEDKKDVEEANAVQIHVNVDKSDTGGEDDPTSSKDGEGYNDFSEVKEFKGMEDGEQQKEVGETKDLNKHKEIVETIHSEGQNGVNEAKDEPKKKNGGETKEVEGKEDVREIIHLEKRKDAEEAKEGKEDNDVGKEKDLGGSKIEEGNKFLKEIKHDERSSVNRAKSIENDVTKAREDIGGQNKFQVAENLKDDVEKIDTDVKDTSQQEVVEEGKVLKNAQSAEILKDSQNMQDVHGVHDDEKKDAGDENNVGNDSKLVKDKGVKDKKKPKENLKVEVEGVQKKATVDKKDKKNVSIRGLEEREKFDTTDEDIHEEKDDDKDVEKKSDSKKVAPSFKKKRLRGDRTTDKGEEKGKNEAEEKIEIDKKSNELSTSVEESSPSMISPRERPVRERKVVERLVEVIEKEPNKAVIIEKGRGTPLKDIPNVAFKIARKKPVDLKYLHQTLFGRRGKIVDFKGHILQFSGFAWHETEEKQKAKIKEKLDKCVKDDLLDLCDLFDLSVSKTSTKKEEIIGKLVDFLEAPHATTDALLSEKDQSEKSKKRKRSSEGSASRSSGSTPAKKSRKEPAKAVGRSASKGKSPRDEKDAENGNSDEEDDTPRLSESDAKENESSEASDDQTKIEDEVDEGHGKGKRNITESPRKQSSSIREKRAGRDAKKVSSQSEAKSPVKATKVTKDDTSEKVFTRRNKKASKSPEASDDDGGSEDIGDPGKPNKDNKPKHQISSTTKKRKRTGSNNSKRPSSQPALESPVKTPSLSSKQSKIEKVNASEKVFTRKKKDADSPKKSNTRSSTKDNSSGKKSVKGKATSGEQQKSGPNKTDLRKTICEILKEVDFNTATFTDILKKLGAHYKMDLTARKASIKQMIQEELTKMADEGEDSEEEAETEDAGKEENPKPTAKKVKA